MRRSRSRNLSPAVRLSTALLPVLLLTGACGPPSGPPDRVAAELPDNTLRHNTSESERLARELLIVDTHVDVPYRLAEGDEDLSVTTEKGDFDYPRAIAGGLDAPFMSIYVPASFQETGGAKEEADRFIDMVEGIVERWPTKFALATSPAEVQALHGTGKIALPLGMENGAPVEDDLANLDYFHGRGIRYITLAHSENNQICDSSYADEKTWQGLSPFGRDVVAEMNRLGIMVDVSHVSDESFRQILEHSLAPVIASHSSCRHFTPGWERNMDDDMIRALGEAGGVIHINFGSAFLTEASNQRSLQTWAAIDSYVEEHDLEEGSEEGRAFAETYRRDNPPVLADVTDVADHIDHVVALVGVDHVGIGSDFDGVGETTPTGLEDVSRFPNLIRELLDRGYSEEDLAKILGLNTLRVWGEVERVAAES